MSNKIGKGRNNEIILHKKYLSGAVVCLFDLQILFSVTPCTLDTGEPAGKVEVGAPVNRVNLPAAVAFTWENLRQELS